MDGMLRPALGLLLLLLSAGMADAGAWPRGRGHGFLSLSYETMAPQDYLAVAYSGSDVPGVERQGFMSVYGEIGVTDRLGLGIDAGREDRPGTGQAILFGTFSLLPADWRVKATLEMGAGQRAYPADPKNSRPFKELRPAGTETVLRPGLSLGTGFGTRWGPGWATVDARAEYRRHRAEQVAKIDLTLGLNTSARSLIFLQAQYADYPDAPANVRLVPTYVCRLGHGLALETALLWDVSGGRQGGLRMALWWEF